MLLHAILPTVTTAAFTTGKWESRIGDDFRASTSTPAPTQEHTVVIAVQQQNLAELEATLYAVSDPLSPRYSQHLSHREVHELTSNPAATAATNAWLASNGIGDVVASAYGEYLTATTSVAVWESLLDAKFLALRHEASGNDVVRSRTFRMPAELEAHVSHIFSVVELPLRQAPAMRVNILDDAALEVIEAKKIAAGEYPCHSVMNMGCWNYYYNQTTNDASGESQMVFGQTPYMISPTDLGIFASSNDIAPGDNAWTCNNPKACGGDTGCQGYDPNMKGKGYLCVEGDLDVQFMSGTAQKATNTFYQVQNLQTPFLEFITAAAAMTAPPGVMSISYGSYEYEMDHALMDQFTTEAMKLGAQGVTLLAATGDDGVAGYKARNDTSKCAYTTSFPATCPFVTAIGGTQNAENDPEDHEVHTLREWAANAPEQQGPFFKITTAGGFSDYFTRPAFQNSSVNAYLATPQAALAKAGYNASSRAIPDVSSNSINFLIFITSFKSLVQGTSGASPALGGLITTANAQRKKKGKLGRFGWISPLLYANPHVMNDIVHGYNNCTAVLNFCCDEGFTSASGWDPLVGLGSPSYLRLTELL